MYDYFITNVKVVINGRSIITIILLETTEIFPFKKLAVIDSKPNNQ